MTFAFYQHKMQFLLLINFTKTDHCEFFFCYSVVGRRGTKN